MSALLLRQNATKDFSEAEAERETLTSYMNKSEIGSPFVKVLVDVDSYLGPNQPNLFEVVINENTTWDYLEELMTKCELYLITNENPAKARKITSFALNKVEEVNFYKVKVEEYTTGILHKTPESITKEGFKIFRTFRFVDVTEEVQKTLQEDEKTKGNYVNYKYVKIEPESDAEAAFVTAVKPTIGQPLLQKLKDKVNELLTGQRLKVGKLLAERKTDGAIFDALLDFKKESLVFDIEPIGLERKAAAAVKNVEQGINAGVDAARVGISNTASLSEESVGLNTGIQTAKLAQIDTENQQEGYYKDLEPAAFFEQFHLLIRNDDNLFGGKKRRTRKLKKSQKNKRKNRNTNKRSRR